VQAGEEGVRFLLVSGKTSRGTRGLVRPIVMNTQGQLREAFEELERGLFLRPEKASKPERASASRPFHSCH